MTEEKMIEAVADALAEETYAGVEGKGWAKVSLGKEEMDGFRKLAQAALRAVREAQWQPIESAPIGEYVLCRLPNVTYIAYQSAKLGGWRSELGHELNTPTHWMPLPTPPKEK